MKVIGLTGKNASGKGEVARILQRDGFDYASLSDVLRAELRSRGEEITRDHLIAIGRELRASFGSAVLAQKIRDGLDLSGRYVIDSFRHPSEVQNFIDFVPGFALWVVTAPTTVRFERICSRGRESDPETLAEFERLEQAEARRTEESGQDLEGTAELGHREIPNLTDLAALEAVVEEALSRS
jgi:dephospho-CoA kinase